MHFSAKDVAILSLKRAPEDKWCYLWVQPVGNSRWLQAFSLIPPFKQKTWMCIGKITGCKVPQKSLINELTDRILWTMEMHRSYFFETNSS